MIRVATYSSKPITRCHMLTDQTETGALETSSRPSRDMVVWLLSTPDRTDGSLNESRDFEEHGIRFNEKWSYAGLCDDPARALVRIVYWFRYDFSGTVIRSNDEEPWQIDNELENALRSETLLRSYRPDRRSPQELELGLKQRDCRLYHVAYSNPPIILTNRYRPVSEFEGAPDLGGHIQNGSKRIVPST